MLSVQIRHLTTAAAGFEADFQRVLHNRRAVVAGLVPQFVLLPVGTWLATPSSTVAS